ncbi:MAG: MFS transporter, partial [Micrococcus sp.]|nr:MFS transporter [Micrococcus sp.]
RPELLPNAVGLNSTSFNGARLLGPAVAGLMIAAWGVGPALAVNALSVIPVIWALHAMNPDELAPAPVRRGRGSVREGIAYVAGRPDIQLTMFIVFMLGTFGMNFQITNALMATEVYNVGADAYGVLGSIMAVGTLGGALLAARRARPRLSTMLGALGIFGFSMLGLALAPTYLMFAIMLVPVGLTALTVMTTANASVQLTTEPAMRGRVMALYLTIFLGGTPLGAPIIGWIGDAFGARWTLLIGAIATLLAFAVGLYVALKRNDWHLPTWRELAGRPDPAPLDAEAQ